MSGGRAEALARRWETERSKLMGCGNAVMWEGRNGERRKEDEKGGREEGGNIENKRPVVTEYK